MQNKVINIRQGGLHRKTIMQLVDAPGNNQSLTLLSFKILQCNPINAALSLRHEGNPLNSRDYELIKLFPINALLAVLCRIHS